MLRARDGRAPTWWEGPHQAVRLRDPDASPPVLATRREGTDVVVIDYASPRRLCAVAEGIARGLAEHFGERVEVAQPACMLRGDPRCSIHVRVAPAELTHEVGGG